MTTINDEKALGKTSDARTVRRLLSYMRPYKWHALAALLLTIASAPLVLAGPVLTKVAVDLFFVPDSSKAPEGLALFVKWSAERLGFVGGWYDGVILIALFFLLVNCLTLLLKYAQELILQVMGQRIVFDLREHLFAHLHRLPIRFFDNNPVGRLMTRMTTDVDALNEMFAVSVVALLGNFAILLFIAGWMFSASWQLTLVYFAVFPLLLAITIWFRRGSRRALRDVRVHTARINSFLQEHLAGMPVVHLFNRETQEMAKFERINEEYRRASNNAVLYSAVFVPSLELIGALGIAVILWYGGGQVIRNVATLGTLIAFIQLSKSFYDPVSVIGEKYSAVQGALASAERIFMLLDEPAASNTAIHAQPSKRALGRIEFRNVWFGYKPDDWILKDVSFLIEAGERVAIVGHTGAGKTTIINLLLKLYDLQRGQILFDGVDIRSIDATELRVNFGSVLQDGFLFSGDIESNIGFGSSSATEAEIHQAAREVHADTFIRKLPDKYKTTIGERGMGLSVGQKQLLSFARALVCNPSVLILDEATSNIDPETEEIVRHAVERVMAGRTSLVIAHRLSTIQTVDKIIVLHKGEVHEVGTHRELLDKQELYWRLYRVQFDGNQNEVLPDAAGDVDAGHDKQPQPPAAQNLNNQSLAAL
jgi:ATP-binding cassette subfamily B protein